MNCSCFCWFMNNCRADNPRWQVSQWLLQHCDLQTLQVCCGGEPHIQRTMLASQQFRSCMSRDAQQPIHSNTAALAMAVGLTANRQLTAPARMLTCLLATCRTTHRTAAGYCARTAHTQSAFTTTPALLLAGVRAGAAAACLPQAQGALCAWPCV